MNKKKIMISTFIILVLLVVAGSILGYKKIYLPTTKEYNSEITDNNLFSEKVEHKKDSYIQILDKNDKELKKITLNKNDKVDIEAIEDTEEAFFDTWNLEKEIKKSDKFYKSDIPYFIIKPIYKPKKDYEVTFKSEENAQIVKNDSKATHIRESLEKEEIISDYLPEIEIEENFKGDWYLEDTKIDENTKIEKDSTIIFKTYQDINDNGIDDFEEEFTVKFETNLEEKIKDKVVGWEDTIELPQLEDKNKVFYDWYLDENLENKFTEDNKIRNNIILYADVRDYKEIANNSVHEPINRKDVSVQVSKLLSQHNKKIDEKYNKEIKEIEKEREELKKYNKENNIIEQDKKVSFNFYNADQAKLHMITFVDNNSNYIHSFIAPYGQTVKIFNDEGQLMNELGVRQDTTIILLEDNLISKDKDLVKYHTEYRQKNEAVFVKVQPITK